ncbi:MAG: META domain-containing protein [Chitinophagaceae bacterium]|nr:META domain-containing protein [Chitinophagaceae bacterium]
MKNIILSLLVISGVFAACPTTRDTSAHADQITDSAKLQGNWRLTYLTGAPATIDQLFPAKIPEMQFDVIAKTISGNSGCNTFSGKLVVEGNRISFADPMIMTKMFCQGEGEPTFLRNLQKVERYLITNDTALQFLSGEVAIMRFSKVK